MAHNQFSLRGVIPSLITPFNDAGEIVWDGVAREAEVLGRAEVHAICVGGCLSETTGSSPEELSELCRVVRQSAIQPVVASIFPDSEMEAIALVDAVTRGGASAVVVAQPHYLFQPDPRSLVSMFRRLRNIAAIPVILGNQLAVAPVDLATMVQLMQEELIQGVVQGGNAHLLVDVLRVQPRVPVLSAIEDLHFVGLMLGAEGILSDLAALAPQQCVALYGEIVAGQYQEARQQHERLLRTWRVLDHPVEQLSRVRMALLAQGRSVGTPRSPYSVMLAGSAIAQVWGVLKREGIVAGER